MRYTVITNLLPYTVSLSTENGMVTTKYGGCLVTVSVPVDSSYVKFAQQQSNSVPLTSHALYAGSEHRRGAGVGMAAPMQSMSIKPSGPTLNSQEKAELVSILSQRLQEALQSASFAVCKAALDRRQGDVTTILDQISTEFHRRTQILGVNFEEMTSLLILSEEFVPAASPIANSGVTQNPESMAVGPSMFARSAAIPEAAAPPASKVKRGANEPRTSTRDGGQTAATELCYGLTRHR